MLKQQILQFILKNWKAILIVSLLAIVALKNSRDYRLMQKAYETQAASHDAQLQGLKDIHRREIEDKRLLMESYMESIAAIEEDYEKALEMIDQLREDKKGKYRNKFNQDREALIKDIEETFGIQYVP
jgi:predicted secreted acid phosphatase